MKNYICPMHPEVQQNKPGSCPQCGMRLVLKSDISHHHKSHSDNMDANKTTWKSYLPLLIIIGLILLVTIVLAVKDLQLGVFTFSRTLANFMAGFFLVFAGFKLIDLKGFAEGYHTYDLLAQRWFGYGYIYPFIELFFGLAMILIPQASWLLWLELIVMTFSGIGVANKLIKGERFQCVCLGTFLKVPLTNVTLIEDFGMAALALLMLII